MKSNIAFIAPYEEITNLFSEVCQEFNKEIIIEIGDLVEGAKRAKALEEQGVDVIISRGGTAIAIEKEITEIPIVHIQINAFDIIRAIHKLRKTTSKVAIIGFHPFTYGIEGLGKILDIEIKAFTLKEGWYDDASYIDCISASFPDSINMPFIPNFLATSTEILSPIIQLKSSFFATSIFCLI